jgi:DNA-binding CsgD family transcriptional regulator
MQLLERETQIQLLRAALGEARLGHGAVVLVSGEAGIGKTSLVEHFAGEQGAAWRILWGACDWLFTPRPLGPLYDISRQTKGTLLEHLESGSDRNAVFSACLSELGSQPSVMVVEDIHWADEATLDLLKYLGRRMWQVPSLLILTYRDDEIGIDHPLRGLLGDLASSKALQRIPVSALSRHAIEEMARNRNVDSAELFRLTNGNPFFVTEVLAVEKGIPGTVRDAVLARAARLSYSARAVLEAAAVIGARVEPWLLSRVAGADAAHVEECIAGGMLELQGDFYGFRHELARQTVLELITPPRKVALHQLTLAALKDSSETRLDLARLAHHAEGTKDASAVLEYAPAAARTASAVGAHRQAYSLYRAALQGAAQLPLERQAELLDRYADECEVVDQITEAERAQQEALRLWNELGQRERQGRALRRLSELALRSNQKSSMRRYASEAISALERSGASRELAMAYSHKSRIHMVLYEADEAVQWGERARAMAEDLGDNETLMHALNNIGIVQLWHSQPTEGRGNLDRSLQLALAGNHHDHAARAFYNLASGLLVHYETAASLAYAIEGLEFCAARDLDNWRHGLWSLRGRALFEQGDWAEADRLVRSAPSVSGELWIESWLPVLQLRLQLRRGDPITAEALDAARATVHGTVFQEITYPLAATLAEYRWLQGDLQGCRLEAEPLYRAACQLKTPRFIGELGHWMWRAGAITAPAVGAAEPYATQIAGDWRAAAAMWEKYGSPYEQAMALMDGDEEAQLQALQIFERLGARPIIEKLKYKLRLQGVRGIPRGPRPSTRENAFGLTGRELEVLSHLAKGSSNNAIAKTLSLSTRTVEHHIAAVLRKTGTRSRSEVVALALKDSLFPPD